MISILNQIKCSFSIGDQTDFIDSSDLDSFCLYETAGNRRPIIHVSFSCNDTSLIKYFNSGNILNISFGVTQLEKDPIQFEIYEDEIIRDYSNGYHITLKAALYVPKFTSKILCKSYAGKTSLEVIKQIAQENNFNLVTNITKTNDKMNWYQTGQTVWQYLTDVWLHSYINNSTFQIFAIDSENIYFYDMRSLILDNAKWILSNKIATNDAAGIINFATYQNENIAGTLSPLVGKNLINKTYNSDSGDFIKDNYTLRNLTGVDTNKLNLNTKGCLDYKYNIITDDYHANYITAYNQNLRNNIMYSSFITYLTTAGSYKKLRLLDTVTFDLMPKDSRMDGISIITGITYQYMDRKLLVNVTLNKEAPSGMRGENLAEGS